MAGINDKQFSKSAQPKSAQPKVQSVLFDKEHFTIAEAIIWLLENGYKIKKIDETENFYRFRQMHPNPKKKYITKKLKNGVDLIIFY